MTLFQVEIPVATGIAALAAIAFMLARARQREREFTALDSLMLVILMSIATAGGIVLVEAASRSAKEMTLSENLRSFRTQIEAYKLQHAGQAPLLYEGTFPQLTEATNGDGEPGRPDKTHPYGPYFRGGIPRNPFTGRNVVIPAKTSPPQAPTGNGGWLYHQESGRVTPDHAEYLNW
ncbi:MAG: type II secretion system protein [Pirellulales bacterium]|nr:type II secretion system protein [Pirellulales bacterium]